MRKYIERWRRARRLKKVPRRTYVVATTVARSQWAAERVGVNPNAPTTRFIQNYRGIEGVRFLPGDKIVLGGDLPEHVFDVVLRGLHSSDVGIKTRDFFTFEVIK